MLEVSEKNLDPVTELIYEYVLPEMSERGYIEPLCVAAARKLDKLDRAKAKKSLAKLSEKMVAVSQIRDESLAGDLARLSFDLIEGITGYAHGMVHYGRKNRRSREYELLRRESLRERNREITAGFQIHIYARHSGGTPVAPAILAFTEAGLQGRLFAIPKAIEYVVFQKSLDIAGGFVLRAVVAMPGGRRAEDPRETKARMRSLTETLIQRRGASVALSLKSFREGYVRETRTRPKGIARHLGYAPETGENVRGIPDIYELVTLWKSVEDREAASEWMKEQLAELTCNIEDEYSRFRVEDSGYLLGKGNV